MAYRKGDDNAGQGFYRTVRRRRMRMGSQAGEVNLNRTASAVVALLLFVLITDSKTRIGSCRYKSRRRRRYKCGTQMQPHKQSATVPILQIEWDRQTGSHVTIETMDRRTDSHVTIVTVLAVCASLFSGFVRFWRPKPHFHAVFENVHTGFGDTPCCFAH